MNIKKINLVSDGLLENVPETITVREMKGSELSTVFSNFNDEAVEYVIESVIVDEGIDIDDLTEQDKHLILHTTRVLTFGNTITQTLRCPFCNQIHDYDIDYSEFDIDLLDETYLSDSKFTVGEHTYERKIPTARDFKTIKRFKERANISFQDDFIVLQMLHIKSVDGKVLPNSTLIDLLKDIPAKELLEVSKKLSTKFGLNTNYAVECLACGNEIQGVLGITPNLFR